LPEAVVMDRSIHPFMISVQFHPERLCKDNIIHQTMRDNFLKEINK
jgi:gamma-glutamyl-gamma-aminobutyrate hydrolase PuuD